MKCMFGNTKVFISIIAATFLMSCNDDDDHSPTSKEQTFNHGIVVLDESQNVDQSVDLILYYPDDDVSDITWQQTSGETVSVLAQTSKVISFTPSRAGEYSFSVTFTLNNSQTTTLEKTVSVDNNYHMITARLSHAVSAENAVSLRSEIRNAIDINSVSWQQTSGPEVTLSSEDSQGELAIFFDTPNVTSDTLVTFNVSFMNSANEIRYSDKVAVLIEPGETISDNAYFSDRKAAVFSYNSDSPYSQELLNCVYSNNLSSSCTLEKLPLLAEEVKDSSLPPTVDDIMDRVVVSHQWMGDRFKDFITDNDPDNDIKNLLRATTAIVIAYDIRPSFYWAATGAIYLDAENLWLTPEERDTINEAADFRADFGNDLQFVMPWRYVKNNSSARKSYSNTQRQKRSASDVLYQISSLMYHELAHANDFFPKDEWYIHSPNKRILDAAVSTGFESDELAVSYPLQSQEMRDLAQVSFAGENANDIQKGYLPTDIEVFYSPDSATDFYAYSSEREDYAMLFEELMMQSRFGVIRDMAITNQPTGDNISVTDYIVTWGQRGRIGDDKIRDRAIFSASRILPEFDSQSAMLQVASPIPMVPGNDWLENLAISPTTFNSFKSTTVNNVKQDNEDKPVNTSIKTLESSYRYYHKTLPAH